MGGGFFFNDTATTEIYTLSLHDALPIYLYESILETELDKRNFRKKILSMNLLVDLEETQEGVAHRPARLYQFDRDKYEHLFADRKSTRLNSSHMSESRMPSSA